MTNDEQQVLIESLRLTIEELERLGKLDRERVRELRVLIRCEQVKPPFEVSDDATTELAVELAAANERVREVIKAEHEAYDAYVFTLDKYNALRLAVRKADRQLRDPNYLYSDKVPDAIATLRNALQQDDEGGEGNSDRGVDSEHVGGQAGGSTSRSLNVPPAPSSDFEAKYNALRDAVRDYDLATAEGDGAFEWSRIINILEKDDAGDSPLKRGGGDVGTPTVPDHDGGTDLTVAAPKPYQSAPSSDSPGISADTEMEIARQQIEERTKVGNLIVRDGVPWRVNGGWPGMMTDREMVDAFPDGWGELTDSPADLPYNLAWEAYKEKSDAAGCEWAPIDCLYGCWRVGDCERCGSAGIDLRADAPQETPCPICKGDGGRYELRAKDGE